MNDVAELKGYIEAHARGQRIRGYRDVLDRIHSDDGSARGSWVREWCRAGETLEKQGQHLEASRHYAMARFPYIDGPARQEALGRCIGALDRWRSDHPGIERLTLDFKEGQVGCWASGLSMTERKPLLIVMGGNVTIKEQWAPMLAHAGRLGMAAVVTEMPSTGENTLRYEPESWRMLSGILDQVADRADVTRTYAMALSFSGQMALRCAVDDARIKGVITVGAPIQEFFTNADWQRGLPRITTDALAHMTGAETVVGGLGGWALSDEQLASLRIPVSYVASLRDEIIPADDIRLLKNHVRRLSLIEHDDVHASPNHVLETQLWTTAQLLRSRGLRTSQTMVLGLLLRAVRARRRIPFLRG
ncbi:alpha/beta hydrolase [Streptomyces sp. NPDC048516]|uniref:alpha/beta hydrolase n=1 Tax=Streptomyces sp. NPDC048516 TaxID=3365565 RepID=UPI0037147EEE